MNRLVILRHGNTFEAGEAPRRIGARTDLPLTDEGRAQAIRAGRHLAAAGYRFGTILTAPLRRTRETATLVAAAFAEPPPIRIEAGLAEIDHGPDEDRPEAAVLARIGAAALADWDHRLIPPPGWQVEPDRRMAWWDGQMAGGGPDRLYVTSNGAARFALAAPALAPAAAALPSLKLETGAWGEITVDTRGPTLGGWNIRPPA